MIDLVVQLDTVALLRELGRQQQPDPVEALVAVEAGGAAGVALHVRDGFKYVAERDLKLVRQLCKTHFNLEIIPNQDMLRLALEVKPDSVTLVGAHRDEGVGVGAMDAVMFHEKLNQYAGLLREAQMPLRVFVEPDMEQIRNVHKAGALAVELSTWRYATAVGDEARQQELMRLADAVKVAQKLKLSVTLHGGLERRHLKPLATLGDWQTIKVGGGLMQRALFIGLEASVAEFLGVLKR